ncbi:cytochrome P450 2C28, partial [Armadillidium vulgare]
IVISNGIHWQNIRRFTLRHLRDLGMGKSKFVSHIHYEAADLIKVMKKQAGIPAPVPKALTPAVSNVIWQLVAAEIKLIIIIQEIIDDHIKTLDENDPRDYIDDYLIEMEKQKDDPSSTMSYEDLITCVSDLFVAGMESTTPTIYFAIFYLASFPEVQRKVQKELDEVLPNGTLFTLADKPSRNYKLPHYM